MASVVSVTLGTLQIKPDVLMRAPVAGTVIVTPMPVVRGPMVLSYAHVIMVSLETVLSAVTQTNIVPVNSIVM